MPNNGINTAAPLSAKEEECYLWAIMELSELPRDIALL